MSTKLSITVGVFPPGVAPKLSTRTIVFTDLADAFNTFSTMLTTRPLSDFVPVPQEDEEVPPS
jgi:hypothetical protein